jgi:acetoin utilization deacetylase AcuC-like enzyme
MLVRHIRRLCLSGGGQLDPDTFVIEPSFTAALHAAGGACAMVRELVAGRGGTGFCALRPAGHHALRDRAIGFCPFNNLAIAAEPAIRELGLQRVFILDWDVHHGNGTADFFRRRADVLFASIHRAGGIYPGSGALSDTGSGDGLGYTINAPVPPGADENIWLAVLEHVIIPAAAEFRPQLILISAGFDAHHADPLADCSLRARSYAQMAAQVMNLAKRVGAPVGAILEEATTLPRSRTAHSRRSKRSTDAPNPTRSPRTLSSPLGPPPASATTRASSSTTVASAPARSDVYPGEAASGYWPNGRLRLSEPWSPRPDRTCHTRPSSHQP